MQLPKINLRNSRTVIRINDPMAYTKGILLGRIAKVSGYEGAVAVKLEKIFYGNIPQMESVFLEIEGRPVPFFISGSEYAGGDTLKLKFEGYDLIEKISEFTGCSIFLTTGVYTEESEQNDIQSLIGYAVFTNDNVLIGTVIEIITNPGQSLLNVLSAEKKEILIPFHEHFILTINKKNRKLIMNIPEGLTEIN
jgi:16S rRNA processing protein RimM